MNCPHCGVAISFGNKFCAGCGTATPQHQVNNKTFWQKWGCCVIILAVVGILAALLIPAMQAARESARRMQCVCHIGCGNGMGLINYHDLHGHFPPAYTVDEEGNPLHSWRVLILPYIEHKELYEQIRLDEPWDSEHNRQFHGLQIPYFQCPSRGRIIERRSKTTGRWVNVRRMSDIEFVLMNNHELFQFGNCDYSVVIGKNTLFPGSGRTVSRSDIAGSPSSPILIVERMVPVNWMDPNNEIRFDVACLGINKYPQGIGSKHPGGVIVAFADASTRFLPEGTDMKPLLTMSADCDSEPRAVPPRIEK